MISSRRIAVTGVGVVCPLGNDVEQFWTRALAGGSGVTPIERFDCADMPVRFAGQVSGFEPTDLLDRKLVKNTDRFCHYALAAADEALRTAGFPDAEGLDPLRTGVVVGSGIGGLDEIHEQAARLIERGPRRVSPFFVPKMMLNAAAGNIAIRYGLRGPNFATASACAASSHALGTALMMLRAGAADVVLAGGTEAAINRLGLSGFCAARALSTRNDDPAGASRPFDRDRDGFVMGEGAAVFCLEELEHARARGATIYAELLGYGATDDAHHMTMPEPEGAGAALAIEQALADAGLPGERVQLVSAHGTATPLGDIAETLALKRAFGAHASTLQITAPKSQVGHLLGAAGALGALTAVLAIARDAIPPTVNLATPDPECDLDYVPNEAREARTEVAVANAFGFGGHNATLVFGRAP